MAQLLTDCFRFHEETKGEFSSRQHIHFQEAIMEIVNFIVTRWTNKLSLQYPKIIYHPIFNKIIRKNNNEGSNEG